MRIFGLHKARAALQEAPVKQYKTPGKDSRSAWPLDELGYAP